MTCGRPLGSSHSKETDGGKPYICIGAGNQLRRNRRRDCQRAGRDGAPNGAGRILANQVLSQIETHAPYGGVVPELAARAHLSHLDGLIAAALNQADMTLHDMDAIAATAGPGLIGGVLIGLTTGKALALAAQKPFIGVNHLEGHALSARLTEPVGFPYLLLLVSGGHCQLLAVTGLGDYTLLPMPCRARFWPIIAPMKTACPKIVIFPFPVSKPLCAKPLKKPRLWTTPKSPIWPPHLRPPWPTV